jgi:1-acyl-sn-glycerol-3-phosphate acyltransferase
MNDFFFYFCRELFLLPFRFGSRLYYDGAEFVPKEGPALLLCNHISHADPPCMVSRFPRAVHFMADKPLLEIPVAGTLMRWGHVFPIDRTKNDRATLRIAMARLKAGHIVGIFPEKGIRHGATSVFNGAELPVGTAALWRMMDVPVIPMVILGSDQMYVWQNFFRRPRPRIFVRVGRMLPPDKSASREELRDRIVAAWMELYHGMVRDYGIRPDELPKSAQERWGQRPPEMSPVETESDSDKL